MTFPKIRGMNPIRIEMFRVGTECGGWGGDSWGAEARCLALGTSSTFPGVIRMPRYRIITSQHALQLKSDFFRISQICHRTQRTSHRGLSVSRNQHRFYLFQSYVHWMDAVFLMHLGQLDERYGSLQKRARRCSLDYISVSSFCLPLAIESSYC